MQRYLTAKGFFQDAGAQDGYYGPKTQNAVHAFQLAHGIVSDPGYYGLWLELTRGKANQDLSNPTNQSV
jgi:peptidoglycan hydrolase-like protein with peptidoglycan-binding domain